MTLASRPQRAAKATSSLALMHVEQRRKRPISSVIDLARAKAEAASLPPSRRVRSCKRGDLQGPPPGLLGRRREGGVVVQILVKPVQSFAQADRQRASHLAPGGVDLGGVGDAAHGVNGLGQVILARQAQAKRAEGRVESSSKVTAARVQPVRPDRRALQRHLGQHFLGQPTPGLPFVEGVISSMIVGTTSSPLGFRSPTLIGITFGCFSGWPGVGGFFWREGQGVDALGPAVLDLQARGAGIGIPALELRQVAAGRVLEDLEPVLDGGGLAVMAVEIEIQRAR
jgi:hypothetical protein